MGACVRLYRRPPLIGQRRLVGWCDSCGYLVEAQRGQDPAVFARLREHYGSAHLAASVDQSPPARRAA
jgi:hypothetical protein